MTLATIGPEFTLNIPAEFRRLLAAGQRVAISSDEQGRLIVTPIDLYRTLLAESFGLWANQAETDSVSYVNALRRGQRLDHLQLRDHDDDGGSQL
jgi:hypothetical protein